VAFQTDFIPRFGVIWHLTKIAELKGYINNAKILSSIEAKFVEQGIHLSKSADNLTEEKHQELISHLLPCKDMGYILDAEEILNIHRLVLGANSEDKQELLSDPDFAKSLAAWLKDSSEAKIPVVIKAMIGFHSIFHGRPFVENNQAMAVAIGYAILSSEGYHFRGMIPLEKIYPLHELAADDLEHTMDAFCINLYQIAKELAEKLKEAEEVTAQATFRWIQQLNPRQALFIQAIQRQGRITAGEFTSGYLSGAVSRETIRKDVVEILELGLVEGYGSGRSRHYELKNPLLRGVNKTD